MASLSTISWIYLKLSAWHPPKHSCDADHAKCKHTFYTYMVATDRKKCKHTFYTYMVASEGNRKLGEGRGGDFKLVLHLQPMHLSENICWIVYEDEGILGGWEGGCVGSGGGGLFDTDQISDISMRKEKGREVCVSSPGWGWGEVWPGGCPGGQ